MPEPGTHELSVPTLGYTLFALTLLSTWAIVGSQCNETTNRDPIWALFHSVTPYMVCTISLIAVILLLVDFF